MAAATLATPTLASADSELVLLAEFKPGELRADWRGGKSTARKIKVLIDLGATFSNVSSFAVNRMGLPTIEMVGIRAYGIGGDTQICRINAKTGLDLYVSRDDSRAGPAELILGEDVLSKVDTKFDLAHNAIRLFEPKGCTAPQPVYCGGSTRRRTC